MKHAFLMLLCCLIALVPIDCMAQPAGAATSPVYYYHWIGPAELLLWQALDDHPLTVSRNGKNWQIDVEPTTWRPLFEQIATAYKLPSPCNVNDQDLLNFVVAKIHNEPAKVGRPRDPDVTIYLSSSENRAAVSFIEGSAPVPANFSKSGDTWSKQGSVNLDAIFKVADDPSQLVRIFGIDSVATQQRDKQWNVAWQEWILQFLNQQPSARNFYYSDKDSKLRWVWQERLSPGHSIPSGLRLSSPGTERIEEPHIVRSEGTPSKNSWGFWWGFGAGSLSIVLLAALYIFYAWWSTRKRGDQPQQPLQAAAEGSTPTAVDARTLEVLLQTARERWQDKVAAGPLRDMLNSAFEFFEKQYRETAKDQDLILETAAQQDKILKDYREKTLSLPVDCNDETARQWLHLGKLTRKAIDEVRLDPPDEAGTSFGHGGAMHAWHDEVWATTWPRMLSGFNSTTKQLRADAQTAKNQLGEIENRHRQDLEKTEQAINGEWQQKLEASTQDLRTANARLRDHESRLQTSNEKMAGLEATIVTLTKDLATTSSDRDQARKAKVEIENKINELMNIKYLSRHLRIWLQSVSAVSHKVSNNGLASLSALINFSLFQMCIGVIDGTSDLKLALANNVLVAYRKFVQGAGMPDLKEIPESLSKVAPELETLELEKGKVGGGSLDDELLRVLLYQLKAETGQNLSPFYTDLDRSRHTIVCVSTS